MGYPHNKAYEYTSEYIAYDGKYCISTSYIAVLPGVNIYDLVAKWNKQSAGRNVYKVVKEIDLNTAMHTKSIKGNTIYGNWKFLDNLSHHSVVISIKEIDSTDSVL